MNKYKELKEYHKKLGEWLEHRETLTSITDILDGKSVKVQRNEYADGINYGAEEYLDTRLKCIMLKMIEEEIKLFDETSFEDWKKENE